MQDVMNQIDLPNFCNNKISNNNNNNNNTS
jgi:hypothetical protein